MIEPWQEGGFGLYVHWPFCQAKCPYCDFNSHVVAAVDQDVWARALAAEVRRYGAMTPDRVLGSVFFGGGTPSLMEPDVVEAVLSAASDCWTFANDIEITLEANPTSVDAQRFAGYRAAGVNRLSVGVQALIDGDLKALGRLHSADEALRALEVARAEFGRVSLDLIYGRQAQDEAAWSAELGRALDLGLDHYALYQLTIEPGTAFGERFSRGGLRGLPDEDRSVALWSVTNQLCAERGLGAYEISNFARAGQESRHNLVYWQSGDWVGVGPGAHGRLTIDGGRYGTEAVALPGPWLKAVQDGRGDLGLEGISLSEWREEMVLMGVRTVAGIDLSRLNAICPSAPPLNTARLVDDGMIFVAGGRLQLTEEGRLLTNSIIAELLRD